MGPSAWIGVPGAEKTKQAVAAALEESARTGWPILAVDPSRVWNFKEWYHAPTVEAVVAALWEDRTHVAWTPGSLQEFDRVMEAVRAGGRVIVIIDEVRWYASAQWLSRALSVLMRTWRHVEVSIYLTTQRFGDLHQDIVACLSELRVFRCSAPRDLDRLVREFGMDRDKVAALPRGESVLHSVGFAS